MLWLCFKLPSCLFGNTSNMSVMHEKVRCVCFNYMPPQKGKFKSVQINMKHVSYMYTQVFFTDRSKVVLLLWSFFAFLCFVFVFVIQSCLFLATLPSADLLASLCVMFCCVFVTFPYGVLGQVWYLI